MMPWFLETQMLKYLGMKLGGEELL